MRWDEMRWDEMRWDEMRWDEMRWDEMRWDEMRWDWKVCFVSVQLYNCMHASEVQLRSWWRTSSLLRSRNRPIGPWSVHHNSDLDTFWSCLSHPGLIYRHLQRIYILASSHQNGRLLSKYWMVLKWHFAKENPGGSSYLISHISNILY